MPEITEQVNSGEPSGGGGKGDMASLIANALDYAKQNLGKLAETDIDEAKLKQGHEQVYKEKNGKGKVDADHIGLAAAWQAFQTFTGGSQVQQPQQKPSEQSSGVSDFVSNALKEASNLLTLFTGRVVGDAQGGLNTAAMTAAGLFMKYMGLGSGGIGNIKGFLDMANMAGKLFVH